MDLEKEKRPETAATTAAIRHDDDDELTTRQSSAAATTTTAEDATGKTIETKSRSSSGLASSAQAAQTAQPPTPVNLRTVMVAAERTSSTGTLDDANTPVVKTSTMDENPKSAKLKAPPKPPPPQADSASTTTSRSDDPESEMKILAAKSTTIDDETSQGLEHSATTADMPAAGEEATSHSKPVPDKPQKPFASIHDEDETHPIASGDNCNDDDDGEEDEEDKGTREVAATRIIRRRRRWTTQELTLFELGLSIYSGDYEKIASLIKTRTTRQVRRHATYHFQKMQRLEKTKRQKEQQEEGALHGGQESDPLVIDDSDAGGVDDSNTMMTTDQGQEEGSEDEQKMPARSSLDGVASFPRTITQPLPHGNWHHSTTDSVAHRGETTWGKLEASASVATGVAAAAAARRSSEHVQSSENIRRRAIYSGIHAAENRAGSAEESASESDESQSSSHEEQSEEESEDDSEEEEEEGEEEESSSEDDGESVPPYMEQLEVNCDTDEFVQDLVNKNWKAEMVGGVVLLSPPWPGSANQP